MTDADTEAGRGEGLSFQRTADEVVRETIDNFLRQRVEHHERMADMVTEPFAGDHRELARAFEEIARLRQSDPGGGVPEMVGGVGSDPRAAPTDEASSKCPVCCSEAYDVPISSLGPDVWIYCAEHTPLPVEEGEGDGLADELQAIHGALDDALGDSDILWMDDPTMRQEEPVQWAAMRLIRLARRLRSTPQGEDGDGG